ncbi:MAG: Stp1/IreP family PP2C-type Ser/Thr phosphatase [Clostridia bacterium]|nr:Stp1/IreP family PP2C-type Ser/Thr phosphatase [Clostridia bacterium]MBR5752867.1 Stp1/IreP family PP2C-type Ser/Thr phosphatase [Clostridia bacterium]
MRIIARTDSGKVRSSNQDSYAAGEFRNGVAWVVVCDGMGGNVGGNVASSTAVRSISERITTAYRENMSSSSIKNLLVTAITNANIEIYDMAAANPELSGMGTTVVAAIMDENNIYVAHAGDSRAYLYTKDEIRQITRDHSVVQKMIEDGKITEAEAHRHPSKNLITRALGVDESLRVDFTEESISPKTLLLICTDGLTNYVTDEEIHKTILEGRQSDFASTLVDLANEHGGGDNITVVAVEG